MFVQTKRSASQDVDLAGGDDDIVRIDGRERFLRDVADHSTAQHARQSRDSCKRVRANERISPEEHVAALSLNHDEPEHATHIIAETNGLHQQLSLAKLLLLRGKHQAALRLLDTIIVSNAADADALCLRGKCFEAQGNHAGVSMSCNLQVAA